MNRNQLLALMAAQLFTMDHIDTVGEAVDLAEQLWEEVYRRNPR